MKRKFLTLLLACTMVATLFVGCGSSSSSGSTTAAASDETTAAAADDAAAADETTAAAEGDASGLPTELTTDLTADFDPNPDYYKYTLTEYTIEDAGATFVATVSANEDDTEFEVHCNFYGDEQLVVLTKDGDTYTVVSDRTGFMETDSPLICDQALAEDNWALIQ